MLPEQKLHAADGERLAALERYDVLDTPPEESFDRITRLTRQIFDVPISTVTLIDGHRQWFKSRQGVAATETDLSLSLCHLAVMQGEALIVEDGNQDCLLRDHRAIADGFKLQFYAGMPLRVSGGQVIGTLCAADTKPRSFSARDYQILSDLAGFVVAELELRTLAMTDALTGALSRRAFREEAARAIALAKRHAGEPGLLMLDLDHFKQINDTHGHHAGDRLLVEIVSVLRANCRQSDVIGRLGGEEFAVLLHHSNGASVLEVAEKLRTAIAEIRLAIKDTVISATASIGAATLDHTCEDIDMLLERADCALYAAKGDGRNRCSIWQQPVGETLPDTRRRVLKGGRIAFNGGRSTMDCTIRTLSETGAGIDFISTVDLPDRFQLHVPVDNLHRICRVKARGERRVEVEFE
jgi:diguanylate cyclase (GGDEF)-like protein